MITASLTATSPGHQRRVERTAEERVVFTANTAHRIVAVELNADGELFVWVDNNRVGSFPAAGPASTLLRAGR